MVIYGLVHDPSGFVSGEPTLWSKAVLAGVQHLTIGQGVCYIVPILIWIPVTLRRADLARILRAG